MNIATKIEQQTMKKIYTKISRITKININLFRESDKQNKKAATTTTKNKTKICISGNKLFFYFIALPLLSSSC